MLISWNITNECNMACRHCYRNAGRHLEGELDTEQGKKLLSEISSAGFKMIIFSGGEAMIRGDIYKLVSHAKSLGLNPVIATNGLAMTKDAAMKLKEAGISCAAISLHFLDPLEYDNLTGTENSLDKSLAAIDACNNAGLRFQINTTVFEKNIGDISAISELAKDKCAIGHHVLFLVHTGRAEKSDENALTPLAVKNLITALLNKRKEMNFNIKPTCSPQFMVIAKQMGIGTDRYTRGCLAGISYCSISPTGNVLPCPYLPVAAGNVKDAPFDKIWKESAVLAELRTKKYGGKCGACKNSEICGGCRARAYTEKKGMMGDDAYCMSMDLR